MFLLSLGPFWDLCFPQFLVPLLIFILFCGTAFLLYISHYILLFFFSTCQSKKLVYCYFEKITNMLLVCLLEKTLSVHFCLCFFYKEEIGTISHTFLTFSTDSFVSGLTSDFRE